MNLNIQKNVMLLAALLSLPFDGGGVTEGSVIKVSLLRYPQWLWYFHLLRHPIFVTSLQQSPNE